MGSILLVMLSGMLGIAMDEVKAMTTEHDEAARLVKLPDADFFRFDEARQIKLQESLSALAARTAGAPATMLAIGAPERVHLVEQPSVPVLVGSVRTGLRDWRVNFRTNLHVFVRHLGTGELQVAVPLSSVRRGELELLSGVGTPPDELNAGVVRAGASIVDLRSKLEGGLVPGTITVTAIAYELRSNTISLRLDGAAPQAASARAPKQPFLQHMLDKNPQLATRVQIPAAVEQDAPLRVGVSMQVRSEAAIRKSRSGQRFWQCNLALVKLDQPPVVVSLLVPVQELTTPGGKLAYNAVFTVDLRAAVPSTLSGTYQVYLDAGHEMLGPYPLRIS